MKYQCKKCKREFELDDVIDTIDEFARQADCWGMESLTENQQALVNNDICLDCFEKEEYGAL